MDADTRTPAGQHCAAAEASLAKGAPRSALAAAGAALAEAPDSLRARRLRARALLDLGQPETALLDLVAAAEASAASPDLWYDVLAVAQRVGDRSLIERAVAGLDADDAITADALLDAVDAAYLDGDLDAARMYLDRAVELEPAHPELAVWTERLSRCRSAGALDLELAAALIRRNRSSDALERLDRTDGGSSDDLAERQAALAFSRGRALFRLGRFGEAVEAFEFARTVAPDDTEIAIELATAAHLAGDQPRAIRVCAELLADDAAQVPATLLAAEAHLAAGDLDIARRLARRALDATATDPAAWYTWAGVLAAAGDAAGARVAADHAIALDPDAAAAWQRGGDVLETLGHRGLAEWYRAAAAARGGSGRRVDRHELPSLSDADAGVDDAVCRASDPETPFVVRDRFAIACELHHHELATALGDRLAGTDADADVDGSVSTVLGFVAVERGDLDTARSRFRAALAANPGDDEASGGLALVAGLTRAAAATATLATEPATATPSPVVTSQAPPAEDLAPKATAPSPAVGPTRKRRRIGGVAIARRVFVLVWMAVGFTTSGLMLYRLLRDDQGGQSQPASVQEGVVPTLVPAPISTAAVPVVTAPLTETPATSPPTVSATVPPTAPLAVPVTAPPITYDEFVPLYFATPEEALADWLSLVDPPYAGTCDSISGQIDLAGLVTCSMHDHDADVGFAQVFRWGVFATDDLRGWVLVDVGSAGWSVADETFEVSPPW